MSRLFAGFTTEQESEREKKTGFTILLTVNYTNQIYKHLLDVYINILHLFFFANINIMRHSVFLGTL